jgi:hypothetical protein
LSTLLSIEQVLAERAAAVVTPPRSGSGGVLHHPRIPGMRPGAGPEFSTTPAGGQTFVLPSGFQPFGVGALGDFPYYWQDPNTLDLNAATYRWIASALSAGNAPVRLDSYFTNRFLQALSKITYTLSSVEQAQLRQDQTTAINQQRQLLLRWQSTFGSLPHDANNTPPINLVMEQVTLQWASPPVELSALKDAANPLSLLNCIPPRADPVVPDLVAYLKAIAASVPLLNAIARNAGLLKAAIAGLQSPGPANGAVATSDGQMQPAFAVETPVQDILRGLSVSSQDRTVKLQLAASAPTDGALNVVIDSNGPAVSLPSKELLTLDTKGGSDPLQDLLATSGTASQIDVEFPGATVVQFGPVDFMEDPPKGWYWPAPLIEAAKNGTADVTGFKFALNPQIDFAPGGGFGFLTRVIISRNPSIKIRTSKAGAVRASASVIAGQRGQLRFLGRALGGLGDSDGYMATAGGTAGEEIALTPAGPLGAADVNARAFVLGVEPCFPAAGNES